ncbi:MAG: protein kinase [Polyangiaceae bacterium]
MFGRYQVVSCVGSGGAAEVYQAIHLGLKKRVALKVLRSHLSGRQDVRARFLREGELAARIQHPNVVDIIDVGACEGIPFIVMEYLEGETLADLLRRQPRLEVQHVVHIMLPVLAAVAAGHDRGVVHRDLKPGNIFLATDGRRRTMPKVLDFGISGVISDDAGAPSEPGVLGTPYYMSSEQARGDRALDARTDQFALGVILYEATTGRSPWKSQSLLGLIHEVGKGEFSAPRRHRPELDTELEAVILKAMRRSASERFESTRAMGAELLRFASIRAREYWAVEFGIAAARASSTNEAGLEPPTMDTIQPERAELRSAHPAPRPDAPGGPFAHRDAEALLYTPRPPRRYRRLAAAVLLLGAGAGAFALKMQWERERQGAAPELTAAAPAATTTFDCSTRVQPPSARVELDGKHVGDGAFVARLPLDGATHTIRLQAPGFQPMTLSFRDAPPPAEVELAPVAPIVEHNARPQQVVADGAPPRRAVGGRRQPPPAASPGKARPAATPSVIPPRADPPSAPKTWPDGPASDNRDPWSK